MSDAPAKDSESYYVPHQKIYPREISGRFTSLRNLAVFVLLGLYYVLPWVTWDGQQAVLFDLPARKFYIFGLTFWPQDIFYLAGLLIVAALSLFFFTALAGRLWCGYACPQTVWTEVFMWMERIAEGSRSRQLKLAKAPWTKDKILRKTAKQLMWLTFAAFTGFTFVGYFTPITDLGQKLVTFELGGWETFWVVFYSFATYGNAGFLREQVCLYMCPYARFQSAMFDRDTLIIGYDTERGEPRGRRRRGMEPAKAGLGDCIDCTMCVQVCPTGIDIREGLQYECIACAACIDACDSVMDQMNYPRGLIKYSTQNAVDKKPTRVARPRIFVYGALLTVIASLLGYSILTRTPLVMDVLRDRNALYRVIGDDLIENVYTLKVINMSDESHRYALSVDGLPGMALETDVAGDIVVEAGQVGSIAARVRLQRDAARPGSHDIWFTLGAMDGSELEVREQSRFMLPLQ